VRLARFQEKTPDGVTNLEKYVQGSMPELAGKEYKTPTILIWLVWYIKTALNFVSYSMIWLIPVVKPMPMFYWKKNLENCSPQPVTF